MKFDIRVNAGVDHLPNGAIDVEGVFESSEGVVIIESLERLNIILEAMVNIDKVILNQNVYFDKEDLDAIDFYWLFSSKRVGLSLSAWEGSFEAMRDIRPQDRGGWCPVSVPEGLVYSTKLKKHRDIAFVMDGCSELVVSEEFLSSLRKLDPDVYGQDVYSGKKRERVVEGIKQLSTDRFAMPSFYGASVGHGGDGIENPDFPGSELMALGLPVLPNAQLNEKGGLMRSAEPWFGALNPGWIVTSGVAKEIAELSKNVVLYPILTEGSHLHQEHDSAWSELKCIVSKFDNVLLGSAWYIQDAAPLFRKHMNK